MALQPAFGRIVRDLLAVLLQISKKTSHATNSTLFAVIGRAITRRDVAEGWTRLEERQQVGRELVGHFHKGSPKEKKKRFTLGEDQVGFGQGVYLRRLNMDGILKIAFGFGFFFLFVVVRVADSGQLKPKGKNTGSCARPWEVVFFSRGSRAEPLGSGTNQEPASITSSPRKPQHQEQANKLSRDNIATMTVRGIKSITKAQVCRFYIL